MTEEIKIFSLEPVDTEITVILPKRVNATDEKLIEQIKAGGDLPEGFIGGVEVPEAILDNLVTYDIVAKVEDEEGNVAPKKTFSMAYYFHPVPMDEKVILRLAKTYSRTSYNSDKPMDVEELNALVDYIVTHYPDALFHTKSSVDVVAKSYNEAASKEDI